MFHSLVMYYLHTSLLKAPFTNVKGIRLRFVVYLNHCWPKCTLLLCWKLLAPWICWLNCSYEQSLSVSVKTSQADVQNWTVEFAKAPCFGWAVYELYMSSSAGRSQMMIFGMEGSDLFWWKRMCICSLTVSPQVRSVTFNVLKCNLREVLYLHCRKKVDLLQAAQWGGEESRV